MTERKTQNRSISLDVLRILSMFLIVMLHSIDHSGVMEAANSGSAASYFYSFFVFFLSKVSVNCFILISGYFLVTAEFRIKKLLTLWMEVVFYSFFIKLGFMLLGRTPFSAVSLISCFFPVFTGRYWFVTIYFGMYLLSPFFNHAILSMSRKKMTLCCFMLFLIFSVWISIYPSFAGVNSGRGWGLPWFTVLYFSGAWFRLHYSPSGAFRKKLLSWPVVAALITLFLFVGDRSVPVVKRIVWNWYSYDSFPVYILSLILFSVFLNMKELKETNLKWITRISASTFGVYLIHAHADLSPLLWETLNLPKYMESYQFPFIHIGSIILIFAVCSLIDMMRQVTVGKLEKEPFVDRISGKLQIYFGKMIHVLYKVSE